MKLTYKIVLTLSAIVFVLTIVYYSAPDEEAGTPQPADAQQVEPAKSARKTLRSDSPDSGSLASVSANTKANSSDEQGGNTRAESIRAHSQTAMADNPATTPDAGDKPAEKPTENVNPTSLINGSPAGIALVRTDSTAQATAETTAEASSTADTSATGAIRVPWPGTQSPQIPSQSLASHTESAGGIQTLAQEYTVQPRETFSSIAIALFDDEQRWLDIAQANPLVDPTRLKVGQVLRIPDALGPHPSNEPVPQAPDGVKTYKIRPGDSLSTVAEKFYDDPTLWRTIYNFNRDKIGPNPNAIQAGMNLKVPPRVKGAS